MCKLYLSRKEENQERLNIKKVIEKAIKSNKIFNMEIRENYFWFKGLHKSTQDELLQAFKRNNIEVVMCA